MGLDIVLVQMQPAQLLQMCFQKKKRTQGIGYYGFVTAASLALGPATGLMVMNHFGIKICFFIGWIFSNYWFVGFNFYRL